MRKYEPIWNKLKLHHKVSIAAPIDLHKRIIQAVKKEKTTDVGWKLMCSEKGNTYKLAYEIEGKMITFTLNVERSIKNL